MCEKVNLSFAKFVLGVHKKAQNTAVRGELGRLPLGIDIICAICNYLHHLENSPKGSLLNEALRTSKYITTTSRKTYGHSCINMMEHIRAKYEPDNNKAMLNKSVTKKLISSQYVEFWQRKITNERKMRSYNSFKSNFVYEEYLNMGNANHRKSMTRFRISAHRLEIERGRYTTPQTPPENRICKRCTLQEVEDEFHLIMKCPNYVTLRLTLLTKVHEICPNFQRLDDLNAFIYLISAANKLAQHVAAFLHDAFKSRESVVS